MPDFPMPELAMSKPYADGHQDAILIYGAVANYNISPVIYFLPPEFGVMKGHWKIKRLFVEHGATIGVQISPVLLPRGQGTEAWYLPPAITTIADDYITWAGLDIAFQPQWTASAATPILGWLAVTGYAATDDMSSFIELEWWP